MSARPNADSQMSSQPESIAEEQSCSAKALFRGEITKSAFFPFPEIDPQRRELLEQYQRKRSTAAWQNVPGGFLCRASGAR